jgi:hypothetical protein
VFVTVIASACHHPSRADFVASEVN